MSFYRCRFFLREESHLEKMRASGYRYVLMDTSFIVSEDLAPLCDPAFIRSSGRVPAIADFTHREFRAVASGRLGEAKIRYRMVSAMNLDSLGGAWRRYNAVLDSGGVVVELVTGALSRSEVSRLLCLLPREVRRLILGVYAGHREGSNPYDLGLISVAAVLASSGIPSGIAAKDRRMLKAAESLRDAGYDLEAWMRPWGGSREE